MNRRIFSRVLAGFGLGFLAPTAKAGESNKVVLFKRKISGQPPHVHGVFFHKKETYLFKDGVHVLHSFNDEPAVIHLDGWQKGNKCWYKEGELHRDNDLPAAEYANGIKHYYKQGRWYRVENINNI